MLVLRDLNFVGVKGSQPCWEILFLFLEAAGDRFVMFSSIFLACRLSMFLKLFVRDRHIAGSSSSCNVTKAWLHWKGAWQRAEIYIHMRLLVDLMSSLTRVGRRIIHLLTTCRCANAGA